MWFMAYRTRNVTFKARLLWFRLIERGMLHLERDSCGLWLIERGMLHLERDSCGLWLIERGILLFERGYGPYQSSIRTVTIRTDCMDRTNRNTLCSDVITRCTLRMCSEYGPLATLTVCTERTIRQLLLTVRNSATVMDSLDFGSECFQRRKKSLSVFVHDSKTKEDDIIVLQRVAFEIRRDN